MRKEMGIRLSSLLMIYHDARPKMVYRSHGLVSPDLWCDAPGVLEVRFVMLSMIMPPALSRNGTKDLIT